MSTIVAAGQQLVDFLPGNYKVRAIGSSNYPPGGGNVWDNDVWQNVTIPQYSGIHKVKLNPVAIPQPVAGVDWKLITSGASQGLEAIAYGNGTCVVVGGSGTVLRTTDYTTWTLQTAVPELVQYRALNGVCFGNGLFVAVGGDGAIVTSPNGTTWTARTSGTTNNLLKVTFANNLFVAVGRSGVILTSPNGTTWTLRTGGQNDDLTDVAYGNNLFVIVGSNRTVLTSPNGTTWTRHTLVGDSWGTFDGLTRLCYHYNRGVFFAIRGNNTIWTSGNGAAWEQIMSAETGVQLRGIGCSSQRELLVVVGSSGVILTSPTFGGHNLTPRVSGTTEHLNAVIESENRFVAVGNSGTLLISPW